MHAKQRIYGFILSTSITLAVTNPTGAMGQDSPPNIKFKGDIRYRYQMEDEEGSVVEHVNRIRARLGATAAPAENVTAGLELSTGGSSAISGNVTLGDGFQKEAIALSKAYLGWSFAQSGVLTLGKQDNPFYMPAGTELIWDSDLTPEGIHLGYGPTFGPLRLDAGVGGFMVGSTLNRGTQLYSAQLGARIEPSTDMGVRLGTGTFAYSKLSTTLLNVNATVDFKVGETPAWLVFDFVTNTQAASKGTGWLTGVAYGKLKKGGDLSARYNYRHLESNAVVSGFTDSDFAGGGGDAKGHEFGLGVGLAKNFSAEASLYLADKVTSALNHTLLQMDLSVKF